MAERWSVVCWPVGEGEDDGGEYGEPEFFDTQIEAVMRAVEEVSDWGVSFSQLLYEDVEAEDLVGGLSQALAEIHFATQYLKKGHNRIEMGGTASNDLVVIERIR